MLIEPRPYGPDASPEDLATLRERVSKLDERVFLIREIPVPSTFTVDLLFDRLEELAGELQRFAYIVDLRGVKRPGAPVRATLRRRVGRLNARLAHVGIIVGPTDVVMRAVARLVAFSLGFPSFTTYASLDEALEDCRRALR